MNPGKKLLLEYWKESEMITDKKVLNAFKEVPREIFIPKAYQESAYQDIALPTFHGQTISQPSTVMIMTQALEVKSGDKILELGSGSGYQASLLSRLVGERGIVYTTEIVLGLIKFAKMNIKRLGISNVNVLNKDGSKGLRQHAPFDRIIITAAVKKIPKILLGQLKNKGILIAPVGSLHQTMIKMRKKGGKFEKEGLGEFLFVPLQN